MLTQARFGLACWFAALLVFAVPVSSESPDPGYAILENPPVIAAWQPTELLEVFWSGCPDCGLLQPMLSDLLQQLPGPVDLRRLPAVAPGWEPSARAFFAAAELDAQEPFYQALMQRLRDGRDPPQTQAALIKFAASLGLDAEAFATAFTSPQVSAEVEHAAQLTERYGVDGVPSLIVNRHYRISLASAGGMPRMLEVTEDLLRASIVRQQTGTNRLRRRAHGRWRSVQHQDGH